MMTDPIVDWLQKNGFPVNRQTYLEVCYMGAPPKDMDPELASDLEDLFPEENPEENI